MHHTQYNHLINILHYEVAKATERSRICLLKTASVTGKEYLLDQKTFLLRVCSPTKQAAENFLGSNLEPTELGAPFPRMFWGISRVGPVRLRARSVELRGHPCAKDCMRPTGKDRKIMKRDLGGLYAVGVFRLNKVGGFVFEGDGGKKQLDVKY